MEITNKHSAEFFLTQRIDGLREGYSTALGIETALSNVKQRSANLFLRKDSNGMDKHMHDCIMAADFLQPKWEGKVKRGIETLTCHDYKFVKDVSQIKEAIVGFAGEHAPNRFGDPNYMRALDIVKDITKPRKMLMVYQFPDCLSFKEALMNRQGSTGWFACYTGCGKKGEVGQTEFDLLTKIEQLAVAEGTYNEPTLGWYRMQLSIPFDEEGNATIELINGKEQLIFKAKTRLVNITSLVRIFSEMKFSKSVQFYLNYQDWYASGKQPSVLENLVLSSWNKFRFWDSLDYSKYDTTIPGWVLKDAMQIIKGWFKMDDYDDRLFDVITHDLIHKYIVKDQFGNVEVVHDGMESGSMFTNIGDSLVNLIMAVYFANLKGKVWGKDYKAMFCGDDNVWFHNGWFDAQDYSNCVRKVFGVKVSVDKSNVRQPNSVPVKFLSREFTPFGVYRNPMELFVKLLWHEHYREYDKVGELNPSKRSAKPDDLVCWQDVVVAYDYCYPVGMRKLFDMDKFYTMYPSWKKQRMSKETAKAVGGIVAYEAVYNPSSI